MPSVSRYFLHCQGQTLPASHPQCLSAAARGAGAILVNISSRSPERELGRKDYSFL